MVAKIYGLRLGELVDEWAADYAALRDRFEREFTVGSGYRCEIWDGEDCVIEMWA